MRDVGRIDSALDQGLSNSAVKGVDPRNDPCLDGPLARKSTVEVAGALVVADSLFLLGPDLVERL